MGAVSGDEIEALAAHLDEAERLGRAVDKITDRYPDLTWREAYAVQAASLARKAARGLVQVGWKMGNTSLAKMEQTGVREPIYGFLTDAGAAEDGGEIACAGLIHPRVEAEIAFRLKAPLKGPGCNAAAVLAATEAVAPALEVLDSRYRNFRFDLKSVVADNTSAARFVIGAWRPVEGLTLADLGVELVRNGEVAERATGAAVLGDPALAVAMLANMLAERGLELAVGTVVLSGAATAAIPVAPGDAVEARWRGLGAASVRFV